MPDPNISPLRSRLPSGENGLLIVGLIVFIFYLALPLPVRGNQIDYVIAVEIGSAGLKGQYDYSDIVQDFIGFRALLFRQDPYPVLGPAFKAIGIDWDVPHKSTHPPTAFLFVAPVALFPWKIASTLWAYLMVAGLLFSFRCYGLSWKTSIGLTPILLFWPPASLSIGQLTIPWLFFIALGYRLRKNAWGSGTAIGLGFSVKYFPGLLILPYVLHRSYKAIIGFVVSFCILSAVVYSLNPQAIPRYLAVNKTNTTYNILRFDNGAIFTTLYHTIGIPGFVFLALFFLSILFINRDKLLQKPADGDDIWLILSYFSVALLPISWDYSLLPLLPLIIWAIKRKNFAATLLCMIGIIMASFLPYGGIAPIYQFMSIIFFGSSLMVIVSKRQVEKQTTLSS
jgi:Glycosyltransferase family 87